MTSVIKLNLLIWTWGIKGQDISTHPYRIAKAWYEKVPEKDKRLWFNLRASFLERFGKCTIENQALMLDFKKLEKESITQAWKRFKKIHM
jgi:hypothetical protein